jgi:hypothetical protein
MKGALLLLLCAGCSHSQVYVDNRIGSSTQSAVQVRAHTGSDFATLLGLTIIAATIVDMERESLRLRSNPFWAGPVPPLDPDRPVTEHDCTKPIAEFTGNLRCK